MTLELTHDLGNLSFKIYSGSTCVTVFYSPHKVTCANVGDSRAIIGRYVNGAWTAHALSRDQKPCEEDEKKRILDCGGRVQPMKGNIFH